MSDGPQPGLDYAPVNISVSIGCEPSELEFFVARGKSIEETICKAMENELGRTSGPDFSLTISVGSGAVFQTPYFFPPRERSTED